ncbi:MAG: response regulator transcription factor [Anaerolineales bacterium]|nr:response regulator transcription factor [Anaerolineales bacterium]
MAKRILIVDDDQLMRRSLAFNLEQAGYDVKSAARAEDALDVLRGADFDLVLLDIGLPGMDGLDAVRIIKDEFGLPVIFLTARRRELDEVVGLEMGADDYVTKPFDVDVLLARIKAVLRRSAGTSQTFEENPLLISGDIEIDTSAHSIKVAGEKVDLAPREFDLLHALVMEANKVLAVDDLLVRVWGAEYIGQPQVVYVHIRWVREKIEEQPNKPQRIITVRGKGYKFLPRENS